MQTIEFKYPKNASKLAEQNANFKKFRESTKVNLEPENKFAPIKGVRLFAKDVAKLHEFHDSSAPINDAILVQKTNPEELIDILSTSLITLEYTKMKGSYEKAKAQASAADKPKVEKAYKEALGNLKIAYHTIGLKNISEADMSSFSKELTKDDKAFNTIVNISNSQKVIKNAPKLKFDRNAISEGRFETITGKVDDLVTGVIILPENLCDLPLASGSFTKHFGRTFSLRVTLSLPCVTRYCWGIPCGFGWCRRTFTIASLQYNVDLSVGYKVTCCGGAAWGSSSANVCASLLGVTFCAGCSASIVGVVGISRTPLANNKCIYGLGLNAQLKCTFGSATVLNISVPFGYNLVGPCPPLPC